MERVNIPRFSTWNTEFNVFRDINKFTELAERLCDRRYKDAPVTVLKELAYIHRLPVQEIRTLFESVIEAAFNYMRPEYAPLRDCQPLFPEDAVKRWRRTKSKLKTAMESHACALELLKHAQEKCWSSRSKVKQYCSMLDAARVSLEYNREDPSDYQSRQSAIKGLKADLQRKQRMHLKNVGEYEGRVLDELKIRGEINRLVDQLANDITGHIHANIAEGLCNLEAATNRKKCALDIDICDISRRLYDVTCRKYAFSIPPSNVSCAEFNTSVCTPHFEDSDFQDGDLNTTYASSNPATGTTLRIDSLTGHDLALKPGDVIRQKMISKDGLRSFGWAKSSKFSFKRWGFFKSSTVRSVTKVTATSSNG